MKNLKLLGLAAVAAMALMAFAASSASATALYNTGSKLAKGAELDFSLRTGASALLKETGGGGSTLDTCKGSTVKGNITNAGGAGAVEGNISDEVVEGKTVTGLTWTSCNFPTTTTIPGGFKVEWTGGTTGAVKSNAEIAVTIKTILFGSCVYGVSAGESLGTLATSEKGTAEFTANAVVTKRSGSNPSCPETAVWTAEYFGTTPDNLRVEAS